MGNFRDGYNRIAACMLVTLMLVISYHEVRLTDDEDVVQDGKYRRQPSVVNTKYGSIKGVIVNLPNRHLQPVEMFLGVPYAGRPKGSLRFLPPVTPPTWKGIKSADQMGPVCPQRLPDISNETDALMRMPAGRLEYLKKLLPLLANQSEDCLFLNIYAPAGVTRNEKSLIPVLVFIHGESYEWNSGNPYDGSVLASAGNIIVITINYRLGIFGFLPALDSTQRGNYGIMDQVAALHWVQENVQGFGGDPKKVTVMGQGHGAACVNLLMLSPLAKGLFRKAILHSGSAISPWAISRDAMAYTRHTARHLKCPTEDNTALVECLRQRPVQDILAAPLLVPDHLTSFGPTIDGVVIPGEPSVLMEQQTDLFSRYDLLLGVSRIESYFHFTSLEDKNGIEVTRRDKLLRTLVRNLFTYHLQEIFLTVVNEYTDWSKPDQHPINVLDATADAMGDAVVVAPVVRTANYHSKIQPKTSSTPKPRTYFYVFTHQSEEGFFSPRMGCIQGEDLPYVFGAPLVGVLSFFPTNFTRPEMGLSETIMHYWSTFVKYGDPNSAPAEASTGASEKYKAKYEKTIWAQYDDSQQKYISIGLKPRLRDHYHAHRLSFWLHLIPTLHRSAASETMARHHLLEDHDDADTYAGVVRAGPHSDPAPYLPSTTQSSSIVTSTAGKISQQVKVNNGVINNSNTAVTSTVLTTDERITTESKTMNFTDTLAMIFQQGAYSTALTVTIGIGCSLLILNIIIFAGVYYNRDRTMPRHMNDYKDTT